MQTPTLVKLHRKVFGSVLFVLHDLVDNVTMDMLLNFPTLIPQNIEQTEYDGYINISGEEYRIHIHLSRKDSLQDAQISCDWKLTQVLSCYRGILLQRLKQCRSLSSYLSELKSLAERRLDLQKQQKSSRSSNVCAKLITEIEELGWDRLLSIDADFQELQLQHTDSNSRRHVLKVTLHPQHPKEAPSCMADIPGQFNFHWNQTSTLSALYKQFENAIRVYQEFWDMMGEIDKKTWILEPDQPTFSAVHRRIAVGTNSSVQITVDPRNPRMLPECRFLGADHAVNPLRQSMNSNLHLWNTETSLLSNLQYLLGVTFPTPENSKKEEYSVECGICYSYRLESEIPDEACNDARCGQPFHQSCLYEWLRALPSSRQSFNTIFGECPYCSKQITVKLPVKK